MTGSAPRQAYSREEARRLLNVSERQLRSWERQQLIPSAAVYGFRELVALRTLIKLRRDRVPAAQIKQALAALAQKLRHIEDPLTELRLYTDGKKIHVEVEGRAMEAVSGQLLLDFDRNELKRMVEFKAKDESQSGREQRKEAERWFQRGLELEQAGAPADQAITAYETSLRLDPKSAGALVPARLRTGAGGRTRRPGDHRLRNESPAGSEVRRNAGQPRNHSFQRAQLGRGGAMLPRGIGG